MRGHVAKKGRRYYPVVDLPRGADDRRRQKWHPGWSTKKGAEEALTEILGGLDRGTYVVPTKMTVSEYLTEHWLPAVQVRPTTLQSYRMHVTQHLVPYIGSMPLQRLSGASLNAVYAKLRAGGRADGRGGLSAATVRRVHATVHHALKDAVRWHHLVHNPADAADPPRARRREMRVWTPIELRAFLAHVNEHRLYAAFVLAALTGMRRGEVLGLRWDDVDLDSGRLAVCRTLVCIGYRVEESEPKTAQGRRSIDLDPTTVAVLRTHRARQAQERLAWGPAWTDTGLVCTREHGNHVHPDRFSKVFDAAVKAAGVPRIRLHDLRHTHVAHSLAAGVPVKVISERIGHASTSFTQDVYGHLIPGMGRDAAVKVADLVFGI